MDDINSDRRRSLEPNQPGVVMQTIWPVPSFAIVSPAKGRLEHQTRSACSFSRTNKKRLENSG